METDQQNENLQLFLKIGNGPKKRGNGPKKKEEMDPKKEETDQQTENLQLCPGGSFQLTRVYGIACCLLLRTKLIN